LFVEILQQMPADANWQGELVNEFIFEPADPALPVQQALPGGLDIRGERRRHRHTRDNDIGKSIPGR
jgi:hypothetical protein